MARAHLVTLACAGLLLGGHEQAAAVVERTELAPVVECWQDTAADVRQRLALLHRLGDHVGQPAFQELAAQQGLEVRPAWLGCFD